MQATDLVGAVRRLANTSVLVVGDIMLDRYVYGDIERISLEAPVPILKVHREFAVPGGAGNVMRNLDALGCGVAFVSVVGDDAAGSELTGLIGGLPGVEPWLLVQGGRRTTAKTRFIAQGGHHGHPLLRADREETAAIDPMLAERLLRIARDAMAATTVTVLSDYHKGVLAGSVPARLIGAARQLGRKIVADLRGRDYERYAGADVLLTTRRDLARACTVPPDTDEGFVAAAEQVRRHHDIGAIMVTSPEAGITLVSDAAPLNFPVDAPDVMDLAGGGGRPAWCSAASTRCVPAISTCWNRPEPPATGWWSPSTTMPRCGGTRGRTSRNSPRRCAPPGWPAWAASIWWWSSAAATAPT